MAGPRKSRLGVALRAAERISNPVQNAIGAGQPITDAAKSKLHEVGIEGRALILKAPGKHRVSPVKENVGRFSVRVELPGEAAYEVNVWQSFWGREWELLQPDTSVLCRVDPDDRGKVLLLVPETAETLAAAAPRRRARGLSLDLGGKLRRRAGDSTAVVAAGRPAIATVISSEVTGGVAPGSGGPIFLLRLELRAADGSGTWEVEFPQRVPPGSEELVEEGCRLAASFTAVNDPDRVAIDWARSREVGG